MRNLITIKSGPHWGNAGQIKKMEDYFRKARKILATTGGIKSVHCVNGCCYGSEDSHKGHYEKMCGRRFWEFISGDSKLYTRMIDPLGHDAELQNEAFEVEKSKVIESFTQDLAKLFATGGGAIAWDKLLEFNSG